MDESRPLAVTPYLAFKADLRRRLCRQGLRVPSGTELATLARGHWEELPRDRRDYFERLARRERGRRERQMALQETAEMHLLLAFRLYYATIRRKLRIQTPDGGPTDWIARALHKWCYLSSDKKAFYRNKAASHPEYFQRASMDEMTMTSRKRTSSEVTLRASLPSRKRRRSSQVDSTSSWRGEPRPGPSSAPDILQMPSPRDNEGGVEHSDYDDRDDGHDDDVHDDGQEGQEGADEAASNYDPPDDSNDGSGDHNDDRHDDDDDDDEDYPFQEDPDEDQEEDEDADDDILEGLPMDPIPPDEPASALRGGEDAVDSEDDDAEVEEVTSRSWLEGDNEERDNEERAASIDEEVRDSDDDHSSNTREADSAEGADDGDDEEDDEDDRKVQKVSSDEEHSNTDESDE